MKIKKVAATIRPQLLIIAALAILHCLAFFKAIPSITDLSARFASLVQGSSLSTVALFSFIENLPGISVYFPGSIVILARMSLTAGSPAEAFATYLAIVFPAIAANMTSFLLGKYIPQTHFFFNEAKNEPTRLNRPMWVWYLATYWHPQLAAVTAFASGSKGIRFGDYTQVFLPISISWSLIYAILLYQLGSRFEIKDNFAPLTYAYLLIWILWDLRRLNKE